MTDIIDRLKEVISWSGLKQSQFANKIGFTISTLNNYLLGKRESLDSSLFIKIASTYKEIDIRWLMTGEGEMLREDIGVLRDDGVTYEPFVPPPEETRRMIADQREIIQHQKDLIKMLQEQLKLQQSNGLNEQPDVQEDDAAECADASGW